jgi:AraC-like DNA-binding protein
VKYLKTGNFFGETNKTIQIDGLTLTDTIYTHKKVDWHYHKNAYFTFILRGQLFEGNKKEDLHCSAGSLLYHDWQDPHYNIKPDVFTRGFHVEIEKEWFRKFFSYPNKLEGSFDLKDPLVKMLFYKLFFETKLYESTSAISIHLQLLKIYDHLIGRTERTGTKKPAWVDMLKEILYYSNTNKLTLDYLSAELNIHPVHLSRDFSKYFHTTLGDYIRRIKINKALSLMLDNKLTLAQIAGECGFADQSHFIRCFKKYNKMSPLQYRRIISS